LGLFGCYSDSDILHSGIYENYLLIRPYPNLRILFASPSLRIPGILQSPFMDKIGGSIRVREELKNAFGVGRGVTAKIRWISKKDPEGYARWIHCTPLLGSSGVIGVVSTFRFLLIFVPCSCTRPTYSYVGRKTFQGKNIYSLLWTRFNKEYTDIPIFKWMIVIVDEEAKTSSSRRFKQAPPVNPKFGRSKAFPRDNDGEEDASFRGFAATKNLPSGDDGSDSINSFAIGTDDGSTYTVKLD
jgi:hypothetical protein